MKKQKILFTFLSIASLGIVFSESKILWAQEQQILEDLLRVQTDLSTARADLQAGNVKDAKVAVQYSIQTAQGILQIAQADIQSGNIYEAQIAIQRAQAVIAEIGRVLAVFPRPHRKK